MKYSPSIHQLWEKFRSHFFLVNIVIIKKNKNFVGGYTLEKVASLYLSLILRINLDFPYGFNRLLVLLKGQNY